MVNVYKLVEYLIILALFVLLIIYFFSGGKGLTKAKEVASETVSFFKGFLPTVRVGAGRVEESQSGTLSPGMAREFNSLRSAVEAMASSPREGCLSQIEGFSYFEDATIMVEYDTTRDATIVSVKDSGTRQEIPRGRFSISGVQPCVVVSGRDIDKDFRAQYLFHELGSTSLWKAVRSLSVSRDALIYDGQRSDFSGSRQLWIFKPDREHICFFPEEKGLSDDYFEPSQQFPSFPTLYRAGYDACS